MNLETRRRKLISRMKNYTENAKVLERFTEDLDKIIEISSNVQEASP